MSLAGSPLGLIADIGGTNARFALIADNGHDALYPQTLRCDDYSGPAEAAQAYLSSAHPNQTLSRAAFAVACPVLGDRVTFTNHPWTFSIEETCEHLGLERLDVVNDFVAVALSVPLLTPSDKVAVGGGIAHPDTPIAVLGPGTGLGVSTLVPTGRGWLPLAGEGGHVTMAAENEKMEAVLNWLRQNLDHASAERVLSGPGLVNLHTALRALKGKKDDGITPAEISRRALSGDAHAHEALQLFFAMLGAFAGNLALTVGALGGVMIAGGIVPQLLPTFLASEFRFYFEAKGRFKSYLENIPAHVIIHPYPAFLGLAGLVNKS